MANVYNKESNVRKLTKTVAFISLMAPASALPLGVGDIELHSALNQNLNAEIPLSLSANENPSDIKVKLAPPDKFDEAGVPWNYFLSKIKFELVTRANGVSVIKLSSTDALREPFLDFLLQVTWPKGNIYREFTVLIDPPAMYQQPVIPVAVGSKASKAEREYAKIVGEAPLAATKSGGVAVSEYGPVSRRDSLWGIAEKVNNYNDVSIEQVMLALYEVNPQAFYKENINALTAGTTLKVPDKTALLKLTRKDALDEFARQNSEWKGGSVTPKSKASKKTEKTEIETQLTLTAPTEAEVSDTQTMTGGEPEPARVSGVETDLQPGGETANPELQERLSKLEQQLEKMEQLLALKDEQLAALQNKPTATVSEALPQQPQASTVSTQQQPGPSSVTPQQPAETAPISKPPVQQQPQPPAVVVKPKPQPVIAPQPEPESNYYSWLLGVLGLLAIGGFGWLWYRKRQVASETDTESMFAASSEISLPSGDSQLEVQGSVESGVSYDVGTVGESSFLSEFTPSDFDAFDTDEHEVDPISEADVYLAYGRYQQAEELIRHAIGESPSKDDYKLKLLEIFYANENKEGFEQYSRELAQTGKRNDAAFWEKVTEMGVEICPDSALFSGGSEADGQEQDLESKDSVKWEEDDTDLPSFEEPDSDEDTSAKSEIEGQEKDDNSIDFILDLAGTEPESEEGEKEERSIDNIDFNLVPETEEEQETEPEKQLKDDIESLDFDFSMPETETPSVEKDKQDDAVELDDFTLSLEEAETSSDEDRALKDAEADFDFNFDFESEKQELGGKEGNDDTIEFGVSDLTDMDEFETKIDLARAYIDMGDAEAARDIAEEVVQNGNTEQKEAAQAILDELK
ncbi:MAG: FimV/HubP family polar landmark protein [Gammaproteobacteria bacterium]